MHSKSEGMGGLSSKRSAARMENHKEKEDSGGGGLLMQHGVIPPTIYVTLSQN